MSHVSYLAHARRRCRLGMVVAVLAPLVALAGCSSRQESYCDAVKDHQSRLADAMGGDPSTALLTALPIFEDLLDKAPDDITAAWRTVVTSVQGLQDALKAADVNPATYHRDKPPSGVTKAERTEIDTAAQGLTRPGTVSALASVQQESLDVCQTPLYL